MKTLKMVFTLDNSKNVTFNLQGPKPGLTLEGVKTVMQSFIDKQAILVGDAFAKSIKEAYIYETDRTELA